MNLLQSISRNAIGQVVALFKGGASSRLADVQEEVVSTTFRGNLGGANSTAISIRVHRVGRVITLDAPSLVTIVPTTSSVALTANALLPAWARPASGTRSVQIASLNNGAFSANSGVAVLGSDGALNIYRDATGTTAYTSANAGWYHFCFTYGLE